LNLIQHVVFFKIIKKFCQELKMNFIQKITQIFALGLDDKGLYVFFLNTLYG